MESPDRSKHVYYLLAVGALLVIVAGGLTGIANKHIPREADHVNATSTQQSLNAYGTGFQDAVGVERMHGSDINLAEFRIHNIPEADQQSNQQRRAENLSQEKPSQ
jgi:hypothetical protein